MHGHLNVKFNGSLVCCS